MFPTVSWKMDDVAERTDWERLGRLVVAARVARGLHNRDQLATVGGFSTRFLGDIEKGRRDNYDPVYLARLEQALGWKPGSVDQVLAGGQPTNAPVAGDPDADEDDIEFEIAMILQSDLPQRQKTEMVKFARQIQKRHRAEREALLDRQERERRAQIKAVIDIARSGSGPDAQPAT